jgi:hypothetical protein
MTLGSGRRGRGTTKPSGTHRTPSFRPAQLTPRLADPRASDWRAQTRQPPFPPTFRRSAVPPFPLPLDPPSSRALSLASRCLRAAWKTPSAAPWSTSRRAPRPLPRGTGAGGAGPAGGLKGRRGGGAPESGTGEGERVCSRGQWGDGEGRGGMQILRLPALIM